MSLQPMNHTLGQVQTLKIHFARPEVGQIGVFIIKMRSLVQNFEKHVFYFSKRISGTF